MRRRHRLGAEPPGERVTGIAPFGQVAGVLDRAPGNRQGRLAFGAAAPGQRFQREVGRDIGPLSRRAEQCRRRGEQQEQLDRIIAGQAVERDRAADLWPQDRGQIDTVQLRDQCIDDHRGGVNDAPQRWPLGANFVEHRRQRCEIGDVAGIDPDFRAESAQLGDAILGSRRFGTPPPEQRDRSGAVFGEPACRRETETGEAAGHQIGAVAAQRELRSRRQPQPGIFAGNQYDLSDMAGGLHQPERILDRRERENPMRQRPDRARGQGFGDLVQQRARHVRPLQRQLIDVDREIGDVLPQWPQVNAAVQIKIALAELEEAAERL